VANSRSVLKSRSCKESSRKVKVKEVKCGESDDKEKNEVKGEAEAVEESIPLCQECGRSELVEDEVHFPTPLLVPGARVAQSHLLKDGGEGGEDVGADEGSVEEGDRKKEKGQGAACKEDEVEG